MLAAHRERQAPLANGITEGRQSKKTGDQVAEPMAHANLSQLANAGRADLRVLTLSTVIFTSST
jgi:hypothetical protein